MINFWPTKSVRIVRTFQTSECGTGEVWREDEYGRIWKPCVDSFSETGVEKGTFQPPDRIRIKALDRE
jgi:hypothetical protein